MTRLTNDECAALNDRTGLSFTSDGLLIPSHQLALTSNSRRKAASDDIAALTQVMKEMMHEMDSASYLYEVKHDKSSKHKLRSLKKLYKVMYYNRAKLVELERTL